MDNELIYNEDLHFEHTQWSRELDFWQDELKTFKHRLEELYNKWQDKKLLTSLDHYENRFKIHAEKIHTFKQRIYAHELNMAQHSKEGDISIDRVSYAYHLEFREQMEVQREMYNEMKKEYYKFLTDIMKMNTAVE